MTPHRLPQNDSSGPEPMDRRSFLERGALVAALGVLAGACGDLGGLTGPSSFDSPVVVKLADYPELAKAGGAARVRGIDFPLALVNEGESAYSAFSLVCPHQGGTVQIFGSFLQCPVHGATFALDGSWKGGQPTSGLRAFPTTYDATAGTVRISPK